MIGRRHLFCLCSRGSGGLGWVSITNAWMRNEISLGTHRVGLDKGENSKSFN